MKKILVALLLCSFAAMAQNKDCDYTITQGGDGKEVKWTKDYLMYEKIFGGTSNFIFFSLTNSDGVPVLNFQSLAKSPEFTKAQCLDANSRMYIQLMNGKIVTLLPAVTDQCSSLVYDSENKLNIRVLTAPFVFTKGSIEELESSPISFIRIKYVSDLVDYPIKKELQSETIKGTYTPEKFFISQMKCISSLK